MKILKAFVVAALISIGFLNAMVARADVQGLLGEVSNVGNADTLYVSILPNTFANNSWATIRCTCQMFGGKPAQYPHLFFYSGLYAFQFEPFAALVKGNNSIYLTAYDRAQGGGAQFNIVNRTGVTTNIVCYPMIVPFKNG